MKSTRGNNSNNDVKCPMDCDINENKKRIRILSDINTQLAARKTQELRIKSLNGDINELEKELNKIQKKNSALWNEKIEVEKQKQEVLQKELQELEQQIETHINTPGYKQAMKHTELQTGQHKNDAPSSRNNYKNMASRLENEIKSLQQTVEKAKLTLIEEIKKKTSLEEEVRELRSNITNRRSATPSRFMSSVSVPDLNLDSPK